MSFAARMGRRDMLAAGAAILGSGLAPGLAHAMPPFGMRMDTQGTRIAPRRLEDPAPPTPLADGDLVTLSIAEDLAQRMRVPVTINGHGPYPFLVDTGADHSALSTELAEALGLPQTGVANVNGIAGAELRPTVVVERLEVGGRLLRGATFPLLPKEHLGAMGLVGLDGLADQRVRINFAGRSMTVEKSKGFRFDPDAIVVRGKARFGRLMLVDSSVRSTPIYVVLDTGAQTTIGNEALRRLLKSRRTRAGLADPTRAVTLTSVTGQTVQGDEDFLPELTLGGVTLRGVPMVYADLHTFRMYRLADDPAIMLGMDTLRAFKRVSIDFARREVGFDISRA